MKKETLCVQSGYYPKSGEPRVTPIVQSTTFYYDKSSDLADLFDLKKEGFFYSRLSNPTNAVLEDKITKLEDGCDAIACASGQSATLLTVLNVCSSGDNIICSEAIYGGSINLLGVTLKRLGIETRFFSPDDDISNIEKLIDDNTKMIFAETVANPAIIVLDFDKFKKISEKYSLLFVVDNTLSTPILCQPKKFGANIIVHSSSKYLDGHAVALGGIIVDCGNFNFKDNKRYPLFNEPDLSYHGLVYADIPNNAFALKTRVQLIRDMGAIMNPQNAFLTNLGMETLALRMQKHVKNASIVAKFLENHEKVAWVLHPSLESNKYYDISLKYFPNGVTGMMSFGIKEDKVATFMENLKMISLVTHVADVRSSVLHPASTTHRQLSKEALKKAGIPAELIRLSVGIEDADDIINDLSLALEAI